MRGRLAGAVLGVWIAGLAGADERALPFSDGKWQLDGKAAIERFDGRDTLALETGSAVRSDVQLQDGTLDFDLQTTRRRSFVYVLFRIASDDAREEMYLRPHKSGLPDATQYAPVFQGQSAWQLYHGPGGATPADLPAGVWTHVRLVLQARRAALFVGDMAKPVLLVPRLARDPQAGSVGFFGFSPAGTPGEGPIARYANVTIRPDAVPFDFASTPAVPELDAGVVRAWAVSSVLAQGEGAVPAAPSAAALGTLKRAEAEPQGFVNLDRYVTVPAASRRGATAAVRLHVRAAHAGVRALDLGFSDVATVFLGGRPLARLDQRYSYDEPRRDGVIGLDQARLYLPLQAGDNELVVTVTDVFGGWAVMGRFPDPEGLQVEAR